jgi:hypothetical protein
VVVMTFDGEAVMLRGVASADSSDCLSYHKQASESANAEGFVVTEIHDA